MIMRTTNHESRITKRGFTLIEILITLIILTGGVAIVVGVFSTGLLSSVDAENTTIAMNLAQRRMEEFKNLDFDTEIVDEARAAVTGFSGFEREVEVTETESDLKQVTVTAYWQYKGEDVSVSLVSYISETQKN